MSKKLIIFQGEMPGTLCAVPEEMVIGDTINRGYVMSGWATQNAGANRDSVGRERATEAEGSAYLTTLFDAKTSSLIKNHLIP